MSIKAINKARKMGLKHYNGICDKCGPSLLYVSTNRCVGCAKQYYIDNKKRMNEYSKEYNISHKEKILKYFKEYCVLNKEIMADKATRYYSNKVGRYDNR